MQIELHLNKVIDRENDLIFFDEVQEIPAAIEALKFFCETYPNLAVCCAGYHIGIEGAQYSFPVGKVNFLNLYPLSFGEFVKAVSPVASNALESALEAGSILGTLHDKLWELQKLYTLVGGMPEAVEDFISFEGDTFVKLKKVRRRHHELLKGYKMDFSKYNTARFAQRIDAVFDNVPIQIEKVHDYSLARYQFKGVLPGKSKFTQLRTPIDWLIHSGLARKIMIACKGEHPPKAYVKENMFKLIGLDIRAQ